MKHSNLIYPLAFLVLASLSAHAQDAAPNSREPGKKHGVHSPRHVKAPKRRKQKVQHTAQYEFYKRVEEGAKEKQRILKYLSRPQFKDHRHFGHKKLPKRRTLEKMRYCNECGIRH
jgi:hypothetical protein